MPISFTIPPSVIEENLLDRRTRHWHRHLSNWPYCTLEVTGIGNDPAGGTGIGNRSCNWRWHLQLAALGTGNPGAALALKRVASGIWTAASGKGNITERLPGLNLLTKPKWSAPWLGFGLARPVSLHNIVLYHVLEWYGMTHNGRPKM